MIALIHLELLRVDDTIRGAKGMLISVSVQGDFGLHFKRGWLVSTEFYEIRVIFFSTQPFIYFDFNLMSREFLFSDAPVSLCCGSTMTYYLSRLIVWKTTTKRIMMEVDDDKGIVWAGLFHCFSCYRNGFALVAEYVNQPSKYSGFHNRIFNAHNQALQLTPPN